MGCDISRNRTAFIVQVVLVLFIKTLQVTFFWAAHCLDKLLGRDRQHLGDDAPVDPVMVLPGIGGCGDPRKLASDKAPHSVGEDFNPQVIK